MSNKRFTSKTEEIKAILSKKACPICKKRFMKNGVNQHLRIEAEKDNEHLKEYVMQRTPLLRRINFTIQLEET